jgi:hypothetical protein
MKKDGRLQKVMFPGMSDSRYRGFREELIKSEQAAEKERKASVKLSAEGDLAEPARG